MINREEIEHLANLSRLKLSEQEIVSFEKEFSEILDYVGQIQNAGIENGGAGSAHAPLINVMREDAVANPLNANREDLLSAAPKREGDYIVVRKIIAKDEE